MAPVYSVRGYIQTTDVRRSVSSTTVCHCFSVSQCFSVSLVLGHTDAGCCWRAFFFLVESVTASTAARLRAHRHDDSCGTGQHTHARFFRGCGSGQRGGSGCRGSRPSCGQVDLGSVGASVSFPSSLCPPFDHPTMSRADPSSASSEVTCARVCCCNSWLHLSHHSASPVDAHVCLRHTLRVADRFFVSRKFANSADKLETAALLMSLSGAPEPSGGASTALETVMAHLCAYTPLHTIRAMFVVTPLSQLAVCGHHLIFIVLGTHNTALCRRDRHRFRQHVNIPGGLCRRHVIAIRTKTAGKGSRRRAQNQAEQEEPVEQQRRDQDWPCRRHVRARLSSQPGPRRPAHGKGRLAAAISEPGGDEGARRLQGAPGPHDEGRE